MDFRTASVVKSNHIIEAKYRLSARAQKFILYMASKISVNDKHFKYIKVSIAEVETALNQSGRKWGDIYSVLQDIIASLNKNPLKITTDDGSRALINWVASASLPKGKGVVEFEFSELLRPYLLQLKSHFTKYKLRNVLALKSNFAIRLYELLKAYQYQARIEYDLDEIKGILGLDGSYPLYYDFKRRVIYVAQQQLEECSDILFDFYEKRNGRRVIGLVFFVSDNEKNMDDPEDPLYINPEFPPSENKSEHPLLKALMNIGISEAKAVELLISGFEAIPDPGLRRAVEKDYGTADEYIREKIDLTEYELAREKVLNPGGYFIRAFERNFKNVSFNKHREKELKEKKRAEKEKKERKDRVEQREKQLLRDYQSLYEAQYRLLVKEQQFVVNRIIRAKMQFFKNLLKQEQVSYDEYQQDFQKRVKINRIVRRDYELEFVHLKEMEQNLQMLYNKIKQF